MKVDVKLGVSGQYKLELIENGELLHETGLIDNLITDYGLSYTKLLYGGYDRHICLGAGVVTQPSASDLNLGNQVAISSGGGAFSKNTVMNSESPWVVRRELTQELTGFSADISEVGLRRVTPSTLMSRTIIKDESGTPYSISVKAGQVLRITYYVYLTFNDFHNAGTIVTDDFGTVGYTVSRSRAGTPPTAAHRDFYAGDFTEPFGQAGSSSTKAALLDSAGSGDKELGRSSKIYANVNGSTKTITTGAVFAPITGDRSVRGVRFQSVDFIFDTPIRILANHDFKIGITIGWGRSL